MVSDSISNLIISLKNASKRGKETVTVPYSNVKMSIAQILNKEGFVADVEKKGKDIKKQINITLKYDENGKPAISDVKRISKFSKRIYKGIKEINPIKKGYGLIIISTPKGIMTNRQAKKENVGGETLFEIW